MSIKPPEDLTNPNEPELTLPPDMEARLLAGIERHLRDAAIERARLQRDVPTSEMLLEGLRSQAHDDAHRKMNQRFKEEL